MLEQLQPAPTELITDLLLRGALSQVAYVAAELRIADHLAAAPMQVAELAKATGSHMQSLHRLMRALVTLGLCVEHDDGSFSLSEAGFPLRADTGDSLRSWILWFGRYQWAVWGQLLHTVRTGEGARKRATGSDGFELFEHDSNAASIFNAAMVQLTRLIASEAVRCCDLGGVRTVMDVGGGQGALLEVMLRACQTMHGVLLDRPSAVEGARELLQRAGVIDRCGFVCGDFFDAIPQGADLYILKNIIHDWNDERALLILRNCRRAMNGSGRLLVVERILPARVVPCATHRSVVHADLTMMLGPGGRERTEAEYRDLLQAAGLELTDVIPTVLGYSMLQASSAGNLS